MPRFVLLPELLTRPPQSAQHLFYGLHGHGALWIEDATSWAEVRAMGVTRSARGSAMSFKSGASRRNLGRQQFTWLWGQQWSGNQRRRVVELRRGSEAPRASKTGGAITGALEWTGAPQPTRRATPPSSGVTRDLAAGVTRPAQTAENAPRKARERAAVEQRVEADEALLELEPRRLTRCSTGFTDTGPFGSWM